MPIYNFNTLLEHFKILTLPKLAELGSKVERLMILHSFALFGCAGTDANKLKMQKMHKVLQQLRSGERSDNLKRKY